MEIEQHFHTVRFGTHDAPAHVMKIGVPVAGIQGIVPGRSVPEPKAHEVAVVFGENLVRVLGSALFLVYHAAIFHFIYVGQVGAKIKGLGLKA
jgi:hypothetical protein